MDLSQETVDKALLSLVRAGMYCDASLLADFPVLSDEQWSQLYAHAKRQTVSGVMCNALSYLSDSQLPPYKLLLRWVARTHRIEMAYIRMGENLKSLQELMTAHGLAPILQKGHSVARFYPKPSLRVCGDIDLCFTDENRVKADDLIRGLGITVHRAPDGSSCYKWHGTEVEHHTDPIQLHSPIHRSEMNRLLEEDGTEIVPVAPGVDARVLSPLSDLIMINVHIMKHSFGMGIGLRQFCDYALAYRALIGEIGRDRYAAACRSLGIARWTDTLHRFVNSYLGAPDMELPYMSGFKSSKAVSRLYSAVMEGGNFGLYRQPGHKRTWYRKFGTFSAFVRHSSLSLRIAPAEAMSIIIKLIRGQVI